MAKNTTNAAFRKINIDQYDEDRYRDEDDVPDTPSVGPDDNEVGRELQSGRLHAALLAALKNPPLRTKNPQAKQAAVQLVMRVLTSFKTSEIEAEVRQLDDDQLGLLMKYVYKGFEYPKDNSSAQLLAWHEKIHAKAGDGCIVRVLTDNFRRL